MTVTLTSDALGKKAGENFTGTAGEEGWLLAEGYAKQAGYTGVGVANTGAAGPTVAQDLTRAASREPANDPTKVKGKFVASVLVTTDDAFDYDYDPAGVDNDAPSVSDPDPSDADTADAGLEPNTGGVAGGTVVTITGDDLKDVTAVSFGGTNGTALTKVSDVEIRVTTPAHAAGAVNVVVTDPSGTKTVTNGFTYA